MTKFLFILLIAAVAWGVYRVSQLYAKVDEKGNLRPETTAVATPNAEADIPPMTPTYEASLAQAKAGGASSVKAWLETYGGLVSEPRKSAIELDYAKMLILSNPAEARRIYLSVKAKNGPNSLLASRIKTLGHTFE